MTIPTSALLFPEAEPLFGELPAKLAKAWEDCGARLAIALASLALSLVMADGLIAGMASAGILA